MKHFTIAELCATNTKLENKPNAEQELALVYLVEVVLDPLRNWYGKPIKVNSGFRSVNVNKAVGGAPNSSHPKGEAADITAGSKEENKKLFEFIRDYLPFDQLINEQNYSWIHVSFNAERNRRQVLAM